MDDRCGLIGRNDLIQPFPITDIALLEWSPLDKFPVPIDEVVKNDRRVAALRQSETCMRTNITRAARD